MLHLRPLQTAVVDRINEGFAKGHTRQLLYAPTGFGKTETAIHLMNEMSKGYKKTAMVMDRIVLVDQTSNRLSKYNIPHGVMQAGHWRNRPQERIQICSSQTLESRNNFPDIELIIIDECHIARRKMINFIQNNPQIKVIGLTATPFTKGLGDIYTHIVGATTTGELVEGGWLVPLKVYIAKEIDMTGVVKVAGEWSQDSVTERGMQITGDIVAEWIKMTYEIYGRPRKTIIFCSGVDHGRDLVQKFAEQGYNFKSISYKEDDEYKKQIIEEFGKPDTDIHGLIATDILTRGFDVSDVMIGVSARPFSRSFASHVQQLGRVMRTHEGKEFALWLDHSGNFIRFRDDWDELYAEGVKELKEGGEITKKEPTEKEKIEAKCPQCKALWGRFAEVCSACGYVKPRRTVAEIAGTMEALAQANYELRVERQQFYSEMIYYTKQKGFKDGFAAYKYKEKFGSFPKGLRDDPIPPSSTTLKWIKSRNIAWAKGNNK